MLKIPEFLKKTNITTQKEDTEKLTKKILDSINNIFLNKSEAVQFKEIYE
jgi:hypothetical protein